MSWEQDVCSGSFHGRFCKGSVETASLRGGGGGLVVLALEAPSSTVHIHV